MKESLLDILRCPECKGELDLTMDERSENSGDPPKEIEKGTLHCKDCDIDYSIEDGIPNMLPQEE